MSKNEKAYLAPTKGKAKFSHFHIREEVLALLDQNNFRKATVVQADSLPITLQENLKELCIIIYAYNGAGKTLTYIIPIFNSLEMIPLKTTKLLRGTKEMEKVRPQALIVLPTQALMSQVYEYLENYASFYESVYKWPLKIGMIYGGCTTYGQIIVGLTRKISQNLQNFDLSELKWVVFDECDKIKQDSEEIFTQILTLLSGKKLSANFLITSATGDKAKFRNYIQSKLLTHNIIELDSKVQNMGLKGVTHYYQEVSSDKEKHEMILDILEDIASRESKIQVIIFFNEIKELERLYQIIIHEKERFVVNDPEADAKGKNNLKVDYVHARCGVCKGQHLCPYDCRSTKTQRVRKLRNGEIQVLLGTETIGRGIDIRTVSLVINYTESKRNKEEISATAYIHRVGRTGRYSDEGLGLTFINKDDPNGQLFIKMTEQEQKIQFHKMKGLKEIVEQALICSKKNLELDESSSHRFQKGE